MAPTSITALAAVGLAAGLAAGCIEDPVYIRAPMQAGLEVGIEGSGVFEATTSIDLPIKLETPEDADERAMRSAELGVEVPYVRIGDLEVSIEWTIKNLAQSEGEARIDVNGGNQYWYYVPTDFVIDPDEDEEPPPLMGDIPLRVAADQTLSGTFREDQVREASVDLEQITRGGINPFAALLIINEDDPGVTIAPTLVPFEDLSQMVRFDITFSADRHMIMEYTLRVRDRRGLLHDLLLDAPAGELTPFTPAEFVPALP